MKRSLFFAILLATCSLNSWAKDIKVAVFSTQPEMHCHRCENKIKSNLRFEKGVKLIETDLQAKLVRVTFDADKTTVEAIQKGFEKIKYHTKLVDVKAPDAKKK